MRDIKQTILKLRQDLYRETIASLPDPEAYNYLQKQYEACDTDQLIDQITDLLLDSFGS